MRIWRAFSLACLIVIVAMPFAASAQYWGAPSTLPPGSGAPPAVRPPACQQLSELRDETRKQGVAIQEANKRKATVLEACKLFKTYLAAEAKFIRGLEDNSRICGVPADVIRQVNEGHAKAGQVGKQVCEAAARGPRPAGPTGDFWWLDKWNSLPSPQ
jgi:hypothetical protein